jgi:hypothetical protein
MPRRSASTGRRISRFFGKNEGALDLIAKPESEIKDHGKSIVTAEERQCIEGSNHEPKGD